MQLSDWLAQQRKKSNEINIKVDEALDFMKYHYGDSEGKTLNEISCIDFSKDVRKVSIPQHTKLIGYKDPRVSPYKSSYFTRSGHPAQRLGIASESKLSFQDRITGKKYSSDTIVAKVIRRYEVMVEIPQEHALMSYCAAAADTWSLEGSKVLALGGGLQYLIPKASHFLRFLED